MDLIQSFIAIAEAAAKRETQQKNAGSNADVDAHPKLRSLEVVQQQPGKVTLHLVEAEPESKEAIA